ncbi:hypothetical protein [Sorangium sp. So ce388]|uniref:hypothetical protein n=1 Tax=Sorangium sp. So ce388 TaxID=3133309 RepID=UPI003F5BD036
MIGWDGMPYEQEMRGALHAARQRAMELQAGQEANAIVGRLLGREAPYSSDAGAMWAAVEWAATQMDVETWHKDLYIALRWWGPEYKAVSHYMTEHDLHAGKAAWWVGVETYWHTRVVFADERPMMAVCRAVAYIGWVHEAVAEVRKRAAAPKEDG